MVVPLRRADLYQPRKLWRLRSSTAWKLRSRSGLVKNLNHEVPIFNYIKALFFGSHLQCGGRRTADGSEADGTTYRYIYQGSFFRLIGYLISYNRSLPLLSSMLPRRSVISSTKTGKLMDNIPGRKRLRYQLNWQRWNLVRFVTGLEMLKGH